MSSHGTELGISEIITLVACKGFDRVFATFHEDWNPHDDEVLSPFPVLLEQECNEDARRGGLGNSPLFPTGTPPIRLQGGLDPNKISGLGVDFELLVRSLQVRNKRALRKPSMIFR